MSGKEEYFQSPLDKFSKEELDVLFSGLMQIITQLRHHLAEKDAIISELDERLEMSVLEAEEGRKFDRKTGLLDAVGFKQAVEERFEIQRRNKELGRRPEDNPSSSYMIFLDLDNFSLFNDALNNEIADEVILLPAVEKLVDAVRDDDIIGRHGGDEFVILVTDVDQEGAAKVAERIKSGLNDVRVPQTGPYPYLPTRVGVSVGVAEFGLENEFGEVFDLAHAAHKVSKRTEGKNRIVFAEGPESS